MRTGLRKIVALFGFIGLAIAVLGAAGCLAGYSREVKVTGRAVVEGKLAAVEEGKTTRQQIIRAFGPPTQTLKLEDGGEELIYVYRREETAKGGVLFLFGWRTQVERVIRYHFELKDGVLVNYWKDEVA